MTSSSSASRNEARSKDVSRVTSTWEWLVRHSEELLKGLVALVVAGLGAWAAIQGPSLVASINRSVERQKVQLALVNKLIDSTAALDPADPKSVLRFGVVAELVEGNSDVFGLKVAEVRNQLNGLYEDLRRGSVGTLAASVERRNRELAQLVSTRDALRRESQRLAVGVASLADGDGVEGAPAGAVQRAAQSLRDSLERVLFHQEQLIAELTATRDQDENARQEFIERLTDTTRMRQDTDRMEQTFKSFGELLKSSQVSQTEVSKQLQALSESLPKAITSGLDEVSSLQAEAVTLRNQLQAARLDLARRKLELDQAKQDLEEARRNEAAGAPPQPEQDPAKALAKELVNMGLQVELSPSEIRISGPFRGLDQKAQRSLGLTAERLLLANMPKSRLEVHVYNKRGLWRLSTERALRVVEFMTTPSSWVRVTLPKDKFIVVAHGPPDPQRAPPEDRLELLVER